MKKSLISLSLLLSFSSLAVADSFNGLTQPFVDKMVQQHGFDATQLRTLFNQVEHKPRIIELMDKQRVKKAWLDYRKIFVNSPRIQAGIEFWGSYHGAIERAAKQYGVPEELIVAIIGVETTYGGNMGGFRVVDALATLAFDYPRRAEFFSDELEHFLLMTRSQGFDPLAVKGSYAGAMGLGQFMPSSYREYAVDFNASGAVNLFDEAEDAIGSVANYMHRHGWQTGQPVALQAEVVNARNLPGNFKQKREVGRWYNLGVRVDRRWSGSHAYLVDFTLDSGKQYWLAFANFDVIKKYNNSTYYAMAVFQLAEALRKQKEAEMPSGR